MDRVKFELVMFIFTLTKSLESPGLILSTSGLPAGVPPMDDCSFLPNSLIGAAWFEASKPPNVSARFGSIGET